LSIESLPTEQAKGGGALQLVVPISFHFFWHILGYHSHFILDFEDLMGNSGRQSVLKFDEWFQKAHICNYMLA